MPLSSNLWDLLLLVGTGAFAYYAAQSAVTIASEAARESTYSNMKRRKKRRHRAKGQARISEQRDATAGNNEAVFRLLDLPPELWTRICVYAVLEPSPIEMERQLSQHDHIREPPITRSCKAIRHETLRVFYSDNRFEFDLTKYPRNLVYPYKMMMRVKRWALCLGTQRRAWMEKFQVRSSVPNPVLEFLMPMIGKVPGYCAFDIEQVWGPPPASHGGPERFTVRIIELRFRDDIHHRLEDLAHWLNPSLIKNSFGIPIGIRWGRARSAVRSLLVEGRQIRAVWKWQDD